MSLNNQGQGTQFVYWCPEEHEDKSDATEFWSSWDKEYSEYLAEDAAEYDHDNRDGHEADWPRVFTVACMDGVVLGTFRVDRDFSTTFSASEVKQAAAPEGLPPVEPAKIGG